MSTVVCLGVSTTAVNARMINVRWRLMHWKLGQGTTRLGHNPVNTTAHSAWLCGVFLAFCNGYVLRRHHGRPPNGEYMHVPYRPPLRRYLHERRTIAHPAGVRSGVVPRQKLAGRLRRGFGATAMTAQEPGPTDLADPTPWLVGLRKPAQLDQVPSFAGTPGKHSASTSCRTRLLSSSSTWAASGDNGS